MDSISAQWLQRLGAQVAWAYGLRVLLALGGVMAWCWGTQQLSLVVPLFLGVLACALAETDDSWRGRLQALAVTLACFALVAFSVTALVARPLWFLMALLACSFVFTLLGAVGGRYRPIASATVILALYTALSVPHGAPGDAAAGARFWQVPALLLAGAAWYGLLSLVWCVLAPLLPVRHAVAALYEELGAYLRLKASVFEPVRGVDVRQRRLALAQTNARVVAALNSAKDGLLSRMDAQAPKAPHGRLLQLLNLYFIAQDIHERASSSHYHYNEWADVLFHSDVLYRCQRVLLLQGLDCTRLGEALRQRRPLERDAARAHVQALADLRDSIAYLQRQGQSAWQRPLRSLAALARNLNTLDAQITSATQPMHSAVLGDMALFDRAPRSLADAWGRVRAQLHARSALFRHAVRLTLALAAGHAAMQLTDPQHGYWILLTTLLVCQPTYGATVSRVGQRVLGTALGLLAGWALLRLFPSLYVQALLAVAAGVLFFLTRTQRYVLATGAITLMVLLCFNQVTGEGYTLIVPRLVDTLIGSLIAAAAMFLVLPDWQGRRLGAVAAQALQAHAHYLREIMSQYATGKDDDLDYRLARRVAHGADADLSAALANMLQEPRWVRRHARVGLQLLVLSHTLLSYLSALGAHRGFVAGVAADPLVARAAHEAAGHIEQMAQALRERRVPAPDDGAAATLAQALELQADAGGASDELSLVQTQLALVCHQVAPLRDAVAQLVAPQRPDARLQPVGDGLPPSRQ